MSNVANAPSLMLYVSQKKQMSLFAYTVFFADQTSKEGQVTAKTEDEAKKKIIEIHQKGTHLKVLKKEEPKKKAAKKAAKKATKKTAPKGLTKLEKLHYLQTGKCFFCGENLPLERATIEHLNPRSKGGTSTSDNEVVCCSELNHTFGDMELKRKFEFILKASGKFKCPRQNKKD